MVEHLKEVTPKQIQALYEMAAAKKSFQKVAVLAAVMPYADLYGKPTSANDFQRTQVQFLPPRPLT